MNIKDIILTIITLEQMVTVLEIHAGTQNEELKAMCEAKYNELKNTLA